MSKIDLYTNEFLDKMRFKGDPVADAAVEDLFDHANPQIFKFLHSLAKNNDPISHDLDPKLTAYFEQTSTLLCTKEEEKLLDECSDFFDIYGFRICGLLFFKSLPTGYMCQQPAKVLHETKLLEKEATRRVLETAQMIFDVSEQGWYKPEGKGIRAIQKVRLMHAGMRHMILKERGWDANTIKEGVPNGLPINQVDMILTCQLFSLAILEGLKKMGASITRRQEEAHFFNWRVVGLMLGIEPEIMPDTMEEAWVLQNKILARQINENNEFGPRLNDALINVIGDHTSKFISRTRLKEIEVYLIDNPKAYSSLGIPQPTLWQKLTNDIVIHLIQAKDAHKKTDDSLPMKKHGLIDKIYYFVTKIFGKVSENADDFRMDAFEYLCKSILSSLTAKQVPINMPSLGDGEIAAGSDSATMAPPTKPMLEADKERELVTQWQLGGFNFDAAK